MKTRIFLALFGVAASSAPIFSPVALAAPDEGTTDSYTKTWKGVALLKTLKRNEKTRDLMAVYPVFGGSRRVAQVAGLVLKQEATRGFNSFEKDSRGTSKELGVENPDLKYQFELKPSLVLNRPRLISATTLFYQFSGGAHGNYGTTGYVFGYPKGSAKPRQLHLADFFSDGVAARKRVNELLLAKLRATKGTNKQEATWVITGEVKSVTNAQMENFVAEKDGLRWFFEPYAMGPFVEGEFEVPISARELGPKFRAALLK